MNCLICNAAAQRIKTMGDWVELDCPECGHFRVSGALFAEMKAKGQAFNVEKSRRLLSHQRGEVKGDHSPLIDSSDSHLVIS
ncbi:MULTISPECIES: hypothetical protein [unclassified Pseudomonas]|uniref:hypothetical protein n=1 Tax=unclassified Pseudomonas TaxID=196821 RepID=UPI002AC94A0B|nr:MULTISPECIES: hypothetical protein [unclassified Pseudomonas]MEB0039835.1 hypothetical protein [Pseudomonas sp. MH10]MEB0077223.1 hypothetical protein [Pseudomonas sp. MH10out]MEB0091446.1 hypothetical protein [Pseudomonas sp. CCI4.2]MEB0101570.1 hypothetical protein [Pseudomonas sp. CCI3.2]MEB0120680.1 hypothetical protein [Pseudomonas sp. CCI1.2]